MKPIIPFIVLLLVFTLLAGCSQFTPTDIPVQNDSEEIVVGSSPSGATVAVEPEIMDTLAKETEMVEEAAVPDVEAQPVVELEPQSTYVILNGVGFGVKEVRIKVGETVAWKNEREGRQQKAMVLGTQWCAFVKSGFFNPAEVYRATFNKAGTCTVVDGMYTTETMKIVVEE